MPSLFGHAAVGLALNAAFTNGHAPRRTWVVATLCALAPDVDWFTALLLVTATRAARLRAASRWGGASLELP